MELHASVEVLRRLPRTDFYPPPRVDSAVVRVRFHAAPRVAAGEAEAVRRLAACAFQKRRKTLANALEGPALGLSKAEAVRILGEEGIAERLRPQDLALEEWLRLARACVKIAP
jgi:16S rRNA (adenine1518-N6/adenine1519-N6)-dimethyltransferase